MLNKSIFLTFNTNIGQDGKIHSYCDLRLANILAVGAGPPSHQCSMCNATMWYNERSEKGRKAVTQTFSLFYQEEGVPLRYKQLYFFDMKNEIRGARSFIELKMVNKINYATFKAACFAYGLLNDDKEWTHVIAEASFWAMASQLIGIASLLLPAGKTDHRRFVIPLELMENNTCALDKMLQDVLGYKNPAKRNCIFRGMTVLLGGDFRQILPAIPNAKRLEESKDEPTWIEIPEEFLIKSRTSPIEEIIAKTYLEFTLRQSDDDYLKERVILTPRNDDVDAINENIFKKLRGAPVTYNSADEICKASTDTTNQPDQCPVEFLKSLNFLGTPNNGHLEYKLKLASVQWHETHHY
uniref:ATP-dependent DNA helicase n=1 Tax=Tanacetum cinerariifolium TaxID=118510 RepID=A0A6L2MA31_TANCI|nr:ATP-dependent DNA helicase PIF1-like [Tanacetum cinerariifolium]